MRSIIMIVVLVIVLSLFAISYGKDDELSEYECPDCNVIIISIDALRADHLGIYGYFRNTSPFIDSIARQGVIFEKAFAPRGLTWPSLTSMLTSLYPISTDVWNNGLVLDKKHQTIASLLNDGGYLTVAFLANFCEAGDYHFDTKYCGQDIQITNQAIQWLKKNRSKKFFLWMHYISPHTPYIPPRGYDIFSDKDYRGDYVGKGIHEMLDNATLHRINLSLSDYNQVISLYDGEIYFVDSLIQEVYQNLNELGLLKNTIVILTADHGEELYQRHYYFFHHRSMYDSVLHIPLIFILPENFQGIRRKGFVENIDILPTILDLIGIEKLPSFQGKSLLHLFDSELDYSYNIALGEWEKDILTIRTNKWRYIYNPRNITPTHPSRGEYYIVDTEELYDHSVDPNETTNVISEYPDIAESLKEELLNRYVASTEVRPSTLADEETLEELRALGYLN